MGQAEGGQEQGRKDKEKGRQGKGDKGRWDKGRKDKVREVTHLFAITSKIDIRNSVNWYSIYCMYVPQLAARGLPKRRRRKYRNHGKNMRRVTTLSGNYSRPIATG